MFPLSAQGVFEFLASKGVQQQPVGLQIMVHGTVPTGELVIDWRCRLAFFVMLLGVSPPARATTEA